MYYILNVSQKKAGTRTTYYHKLELYYLYYFNIIQTVIILQI
jgi:hypothetical protein